MTWDEIKTDGVEIMLIRKHKYGYLYKQRIKNVILCEAGEF